jgi:DNA-binding CsgD family transcriptional regulator
LACFFAWVYCTLYGCGLVTSAYVHWGLEYFWSATGLAMAVLSIVLLIAYGHVGTPPQAAVKAIGTIAAIAGSFAIWLGYFDHSLFWIMRTVAGICCGIGFIVFSVLWLKRLSGRDEDAIEFTISAAFVITFLLYCAILLLKVSAISVLVVDALFPLLSLYCVSKASVRGKEGEENGGSQDSRLPSESEPLAPEPSEKRSALRNYATLMLLLVFLWFQIAYFRVLSTPEELGNRYQHFLIAFFSASVVATILFIMCIYISRMLNFSLIFRWSLPLFVLSYAVYFLNPGDPTVRMISYAVNFCGMFGVQFGCWVSAAKYLSQSGESPVVMTLALSLAQGIGIFAGFQVCRSFITSLPLQTFTSLSLLLMTVVVMVSMAVGFNPRWYNFHAAKAPAVASPKVAVTLELASEKSNHEPQQGADLDTLFAQQALVLQRTYGLTERETEVAALLLAGRSRPYIRDELIISLNTVHAHVRHIFSKCGVHSQQELLDLARNMAA